MYKWNELLKQVNCELEKLDFERPPYSLYAPIRYVLGLGGKRIRPVFMLLAYNLYREDIEKIYFQALGIEVYHNYTLLHDDLMDKAELRRGKQTVHKKWSDNAAILSGDSMLVLAYRYMQRCEPDKMQAVLSLFTETALEIGEGQQYDMEFETRNDVSEDEYIEMIRLKTSVLLACALKMGAILAGAPTRDAELLYKYGECIGLAFQLQDDFLDVYGDPAVFGKNIGGDILCDKKTFLLIKAEELAMGQQREILDKYIGNQNCDREEKIKAVVSVYNALDVRGLCEERMEQYFERGMEALDEMSVPAAKKTVLKEFAISLLHRNL